MSDLYINIRFGSIHWQVGKNWPWLQIKRNGYWVENPPGFKDWFKIYQIFNYNSHH